MANLETLRSHGWHITSEGLSVLSETGEDIRSITRRALDVDIREFGAPIISSELNKTLFGPINLQIVKLRNISAPKCKPNSQGAPRMLKLILTDGHTNCQGVEIKHISSLSLEKTIPGTKIFINGAPVLSGSILLSPENCKVLGGNVSALVEKWELSKLMPSHIRHNEDGPPAWVNFGKKIINTLDNRGFKSLENKNKENSKENAEFQNLRQDAIMEATQGAVKKVFGGGVKPSFNQQENYNHNHRAPRQPKPKKEKPEPEKMEKPSQRVSLFDFLEDKLPEQKNPPRQNPAPKFEAPKTRDREPKFKPPQTSFSSPIAYSKPEFETKLKTSERFLQNERPPRFQKQKQEVNKFAERTKPNTNIFVDKLANEINNISLYNSKYENEKLKQNRNQNKDQNNIREVREAMNRADKNWKWKIGDRCMAKYWEDDKFYNAVVTGITNKTCMVEFIEYGNFEEVLHCDCIPITSEKEDKKHSGRFGSDNQDFSGSIEFRRGKSRPFIKNAYKQNRSQDS